MTEHHYATINGIRLHYVTAGSGSGDPIVFLHGFPEYWGVWRDQIASFADRHLVVVPDMRGANESERPIGVEHYHIRELVADLLGLLDHLGLARVTLVAQDWGALIGWSFLLRHPERVSKYVSINITHPTILNRELRENPAHQQASAYMLAFRSAAGEDILLADDAAFLDQVLFADARAHGAEISTEDQAAWRGVMANRDHLGAGLNFYRAAELGPPDGVGPGGSNLVDDLRPEQLRVETPILMIWGDLDPFLLSSGLVGLEQYAPNARVEHILDATHWVSLERPTQVSALIHEFLGD